MKKFCDPVPPGRLTPLIPLGFCLLLLTVFGCTSALRTPPSSAFKPPLKKKVISKPRPDFYSAPGKSRPRPYQVRGEWYQPLARSEGFRQQGIASWYGEAFHGRRTSSGEIYNMFGISAAHKILPLHTYVRVKNLENGRTMTLRINDRGPFIPGRIIDLSYGAARKLGVWGPGTARVEIEAVGVAKPSVRKADAKARIPGRLPAAYVPVNLDTGKYYVQVGAFGDRANAEKLKGALNSLYRDARIKKDYCRVNRKDLYRVLVGSSVSLKQAEAHTHRLKAKGFKDAFTIAE